MYTSRKIWAVHMKHDNNCFLYSGKFGPYTCTIGTAKKSSKLGGMKQFIAYQVDLEEICHIVTLFESCETYESFFFLGHSQLQ